ncbi:MAG: RES domain-containing protein [Burkholderia sp.]
MKLFRIADGRHPVWSGTGAMLLGGRFNSPGRAVIYAGTTFAGAMLEVLVHARIGKVPRTHVWVEAEAPAAISVERLSAQQLPAGWDSSSPHVARGVGDAWLGEQRSAILLVPSVVTRAEWNALINPLHPEAAGIVVRDPQPVIWDERLFVAPRGEA